MALSSDIASSLLQQHCSGDSVREEQKLLYTDIILSRMLSAANSAAALAAATNGASISNLSISPQRPASHGGVDGEESADLRPSSGCLELTNNAKKNKKLSFSVDSLLTTKDKSANIVFKGFTNLEKNFNDKHSRRILDKKLAEEEEDFEIDSENAYDEDRDDVVTNEQENISVDDQEMEDERKHGLNSNNYGSSKGAEASSSKLVVPRPIIPVSQLPVMNSPPNLMAGIAQAMAVAAAANAAASSRYNLMCPTISVSDKSLCLESSATENGSVWTKSSLPTPLPPPGYPLGITSPRPSFLGKQIHSYIQ